MRGALHGARRIGHGGHDGPGALLEPLGELQTGAPPLFRGLGGKTLLFGAQCGPFDGVLAEHFDRARHLAHFVGALVAGDGRVEIAAGEAYHAPLQEGERAGDRAADEPGEEGGDEEGGEEDEAKVPELGPERGIEIVDVDPGAGQQVPGREGGDVAELGKGYFSAGLRVPVGERPAARLGHPDLLLDERNALGILCREPVGALDFRRGAENEGHAIHAIGEDVAGAIIEAERADGVAEGAERLITRHLARLDLLFEVGGHRERHLGHGAELVDAGDAHFVILLDHGECRDGDQRDERRRGDDRDAYGKRRFAESLHGKNLLTL